jgi:2-oxoglutarate dehydrogenase E1 component
MIDIMEKDFGVHALNSGYLIDLYERFLRDPHSLDPQTRGFFEHWQPAQEELAPAAASVVQAALPFELNKVVAAVNLAQAIRSFGHLAARLDPLGHPARGDPALNPDFYGISEQDLRLLPAEIIKAGSTAKSAAGGSAWEAIQNLRSIYSGTIGYDYGHVHVPEERDWLRSAAEDGLFRSPNVELDAPALLERLTEVEVFEQFLNRFFPGKTRFSIEGLDMMVPMMDQIIDEAGNAGICEILIGMPHRGRLNVLAHVLNTPYEAILAEFKDPGNRYLALHQLGWTGDVKYHRGGTLAVKGGEEIRIVIKMPANPSHLELVNPVIAGMTRAAQTGQEQAGSPLFFPAAAVPILVHGDASFPGEGIVAETLNLSRLPGYQNAGAIHLIGNNQIGYTTLPEEGRSTLYASDLAKGFEIPILHVNADDPPACLEAVRTAFAYRQKFHKDFVIDLIGYRRYGHNEGDEPSFTQPLMYQEIEAHPSIRKIWAERLAAEGQVQAEWPEQLVSTKMEELRGILEHLNPEKLISIPALDTRPDQNSHPVKTAVSQEKLRELHRALLDFPPDFHLNRKLERAVQRERKALDESEKPAIEWALAERLALASILADGTAIRLTGQDVERGTFSQRHAVFHDTGHTASYVPLQELPQARASFEIHNTPLSENAALAFEYGYSIFAPNCLVIWEAQYGDFINNAQSILDEFVTSGRAKWEQKPALALLLPHGYEGQGPNHSSARPERFLELATANNLRVANCTTAAQYFHLLRLQAALLNQEPVPLVVFTPKSLLRHPLVASRLQDLSKGSWQPVLDDALAGQEPERVRRLALCTGKVAIDLMENEQRAGQTALAIVRLEQLYPFPKEELGLIFEKYNGLEEIVWVQEEPQNMGAWNYVQPRLNDLLGERLPLRYIGRARSSSPAEGSAAWHAINQKALIEQVYHLTAQPALEGAILYKD